MKSWSLHGTLLKPFHREMSFSNPVVVPVPGFGEGTCHHGSTRRLFEIVNVAQRLSGSPAKNADTDEGKRKSSKR